MKPLAVAPMACVLVACALLAPLSRVAAQAPDWDRIVTADRQVTVSGKPLRYTARAGYLPILDNYTGEVHGHMFFTAYSLPRASGAAARPLTFVWNGGPGSSSSLVHLIGFGPRRIGADDKAIDNDGTWLDFTDLVFVDPIGTGYSRPAKTEFGQEFYQTRGDAESVAEFIRVYRNRFDGTDAPLFLAGESFGVTRASGVADVLQRREIHVSGVVVIGLSLPLGQLTSEERTAFNLPTYTAAAFFHRKLPADLQQGDLQSALRKAEAWAIERYAPALTRRDALTDTERTEVVEGLARFTGIKASDIDRKTIAIGMPQFSEQLLRDRNLIVGRYDSRLTGTFDIQQTKMYDPTKDPSLEDLISDAAIVRYFRSELKYDNDLQYQGPFGGGYPPATSFRGDWMSVRWNFKAVHDVEQPLVRAMTTNSALRVLSSCGYYDLVCSYFTNEQLAARLDPAMKSRVQVRNYGGAHAVYTDDGVRIALKRDVATFIQSAAKR